MIKSLVGAAGALSLGVAISTTSVTPAAADAGAFFAGMVGGTALGAIAAGAAAPRYYAPPVYAAPVEYAPAECWVERRPVLDPDGYVVGSRPTRICE